MAKDSKYQVGTRLRESPFIVAIVGLAVIAGASVLTFVCVDRFSASVDAHRLEQVSKERAASQKRSISEVQYEGLKIGMTKGEVQGQIGFVPNIQLTVGRLRPDKDSDYIPTSLEFGVLHIAEVGSVVTVFQRRRLVAMGGFHTMRLCKSCAIDIEKGDRDPALGLPRFKEGICPECGSETPYDVPRLHAPGQPFSLRW